MNTANLAAPPYSVETVEMKKPGKMPGEEGDAAPLNLALPGRGLRQSSGRVRIARSEFNDALEPTISNTCCQRD
jgi:hypothetical protein